MTEITRSAVRYWLRSIAYNTPLAGLGRRLVPRANQGAALHETSAYWNEETTRYCSTVNGMVGCDVRDALTATLARSFGTMPRRVLDIGCANGGLADALIHHGLEHYIGVDLSDAAMERGRDRPNPPGVTRAFIAADVRAYTPPDDHHFDLIAFNEMLYYLDVPVAIEQVTRLAERLAPNGLILVSMKDDPKSHAIFRGLTHELRWVYGTLIQQQESGPSFRLSRNRRTPASVIGALKRGTVPISAHESRLPH